MADYTSDLQNDQQLQSTLQGLAALAAQYQSALKGQVQQAVEQYGEVPTGLSGDFSGFIDPTTTALAQQGTAAGLTTTARLAHAYDIARQQSLSSLAARGMLHSGALGQHENENLLAYHGQQFDALQQLLQGLRGYQGTYLGQQAGVQQQQEQATNDALNRILQRIQTNPSPPPGPQSDYGVPGNLPPWTGTGGGNVNIGGQTYDLGGFNLVGGAGGSAPAAQSAPAPPTAPARAPAAAPSALTPNVRNTVAAVRGGATVLGF